MNFKEYLNKAWSVHATSPEKTLEEAKQQIPLLESEADLLALSNLIVHLSGEHLGDWRTGLELLRKLKNNSLLKNRTEMNRYVAILELGNNSATTIEHFSISDQARIYASTASALANLGGLKLALNYLTRAQDLVKDLPKEDLANKSLAMTGNNIAVTLEEKKDRNPNETEVMISAAKTGRFFWEKAGGWREIERAEYRLAHSYMAAGLLDQALIHAQECLKIVGENKNEPLELFFALEAMGLIAKAKNDKTEQTKFLKEMTAAFNNLSPDHQASCKSSLTKVEL